MTITHVLAFSIAGHTGVLNVLEGSDCEIEIRRGMTEADLKTSFPQSITASRALPGSVAPATNLVSQESTRTRVAPSKPQHSNTTTTITATTTTTTMTPNAVETLTSQLPTTDCVIIPYDQLVAQVDIVGVDPAHKERHLSELEFGTIFGISRKEWQQLPAWKRTALRKKCGLF